MTMVLAILAALPAKVTRVPLTDVVSRHPTPFIAAAITAVAGLALYFYLSRGSSGSDVKGKSRRAPALKGPSEAIECRLLKREAPTHNTLLLRFALPAGANCLGLGAGKHIGVVTGTKGDDKQPEARRSYTPITTDHDQMTTFDGQSFDILIKVYRPLPPKYANGGVVSQRLAALRPGDKARIVGPTGLFEYLGRGSLVRKPGEQPRKCKHLALIAGGTGITPILQILKTIAEDDSDATTASLVYANSTVDDVLLYSELVHLGARKNINVWFTVSQAPSAAASNDEIPLPWKYSTGRIDGAMITKHLPLPSGGDVIALLCGPAPMVNETCKPILAAAGFESDNVIVL